MAYKDKDRQREAVKQAMRRKRATSVIPCDTRLKVIPSDTPIVIPCEVEIKPERTAKRNIRVSKPGDDDHVPMCETTSAFIEGRDKRQETAKRGLDIKCFEDLPPDVQESIRTVSESNEEFKRRTGIAIRYQHLFPDSLEVAVGSMNETSDLNLTKALMMSKP